MRGATHYISLRLSFTHHFNPRSSCEERRHHIGRTSRQRDFNPRSSCEERLRHRAVSRPDSPISIHAPHARSDPGTIGRAIVSSLFQSTLLMRGATISGARQKYFPQFQSTLLMRGATVQLLCADCHNRFQSTLLMRGATRRLARSVGAGQISIHAPHARSDSILP